MLALLFESIELFFLVPTWVISHVPMFHITQPLGIWSIMATFSGDVQYSQVMGHLPTPVQRPQFLYLPTYPYSAPSVLGQIVPGQDQHGIHQHGGAEVLPVTSWEFGMDHPGREGGVGLDPFFPEKNGETQFGENSQKSFACPEHR